jgi:hypothetical protein
LAFRTAVSSPLICEVIRLEIAKPAASSAAEFILWPVESRSIVWLIARSFFESAFAVTVAAVFVLITVMMILL